MIRLVKTLIPLLARERLKKKRLALLLLPGLIPPKKIHRRNTGNRETVDNEPRSKPRSASEHHQSPDETQGEDKENPQQQNVDGEKNIPETEEQTSRPPLNQDTDAGPEASTFDKVEGPARPPPTIITGNAFSSELMSRKTSLIISLLPIYLKAQ